MRFELCALNITVNINQVVAISLSVAKRKNESIRNTLARTRDRCWSQVCKQYEIKIDQSHLSKETLEHLERLFLEAKWFYNAIIASQDIFSLPDDYYKAKQVTVKVKDSFETRNLECLSSQMKQEILDRTKAVASHLIFAKLAQRSFLELLDSKRDKRLIDSPI